MDDSIVVNTKLRDFFESTMARVGNGKAWTHQYLNQNYFLVEEKYKMLIQLNPKAGTFSNLEEKNMQRVIEDNGSDNFLRAVIDLDTDKDVKTDKNLPKRVLEGIVSYMEQKKYEFKLFGVVMYCEPRFHIHILNLCFRTKQSLNLFNQTLKQITDIKAIDVSAGTSHMLMHGSLKQRSNNMRMKCYEPYKYFIIDTIRLSENKLHLEKRASQLGDWPYTDKNTNLFGLLSLQRKRDAFDLYFESEQTDGKQLERCVVRTLVPTDRKRKIEASEDASDSATRKKKVPKIKESEPKNEFLTEYIMKLAAEHADDYNDWVKVGFALANYLGEGGFSLFKSFSKASKKYDSREVESKWTEILQTVESGEENRSKCLPQHLWTELSNEEENLLHEICFENYSAVTSRLKCLANYLVRYKSIVCIDHPYYVKKVQIFVYSRKLGHYVMKDHTVISEWTNEILDKIARMMMKHFSDQNIFGKLHKCWTFFCFSLNVNAQKDFWKQIEYAAQNTKKIKMSQYNICFSYGETFNFETGRLETSSPNHYCRAQNKCQIDLVKDDDKKEIVKLLFTWFPNNETRRYVVDMLRTFLLPGNHYNRGVYILYGPKGNGKSLFLKIIMGMFENEEMAFCIPSDDFTQPSKAINAVFKNCYGQERIAGVVDFPFTKLVSCGKTLLKQISGSDELSGRMPYKKDNYKKRLHCKVVVATNELPILLPTELEMLDRYVVISMNTVFTNTTRDDRSLMDRYPALSAALLKILLDDWTENKFTPQMFLTQEHCLPRLRASDKILRKIMRSNDPVRQFYKSCTVYDPRKSIDLKVFQKYYGIYMKERSMNFKNHSAHFILDALHRLKIVIKRGCIENRKIPDYDD